MADIRKKITEQIVAALEAGTPPWRKGWTTTGGLHFNGATQKPYRGLNQILLGMAACQLPEMIDGKPTDTADPRWMTMKQANALNLKIRKGSHAAKIIRMVEVPANAKTADGDEVLAEDKGTRLVLKQFHVFNGSQIEKLAPLPPRENKVTPIEAADAIAAGMRADGITILHGGNSASYFEKLDTVRMPEQSAFRSTEDYYSTLLHELAHATGAEKRLKRLHRTARFGLPNYAKEELVAEIAATMACAEAGISMGPSHIENHAAYVASWVECLKADKNAIFVAAGAAERACDYLRKHAVEANPQADAVVAEQPAPGVAAPKRSRGMRM